MSTETTPAIRVSKERSVSMPLVLLISILTMCALGYSTWASTKEQVIRNSADIVDLRFEAQKTREILIRIDENVKDLRRERRTTP